MNKVDRFKLRFLIQSLLDKMGITERLHDTDNGFVIWERDVYIDAVPHEGASTTYQCYWKSVVISSTDKEQEGQYQTKVESETDNLVQAAENFVSMIVNLDIMITLDAAFNKISAFELAGHDLATASQLDIRNFKVDSSNGG